MQPDELCEQLQAGASILEPYLRTHRFTFQNMVAGRGSGGFCAQGEFVRAGLNPLRRRKIKLHERQGLGIVYYSIGRLCVDHGRILKAMGVDRQSRFLWSPKDVGLERYRLLLADLQHYFVDFLAGNAAHWKAIARQATELREAAWPETEAGYVGDKRIIRQAREAFRSHDYSQVVQLLEGLQFPERLSNFEQRMRQAAERRRGQ